MASTAETIHYVVERAMDSTGPWHIAVRTPDTNWVDTDAVPSGHIPMVFTGAKDTVGTAKLTLRNPWYNWESNWRASYYYRVRCEDNEFEHGAPAPANTFYSGVNVKPVRYLIRRKIDTGTPATLDGVDAITVKEWRTNDINPADEFLTFLDSALPNAIYSFTSYVIDDKGLVGQPYMITVDMR